MSQRRALRVGIAGLGQLGVEVAARLHELGSKQGAPVKLTHLWGEPGKSEKYVPQAGITRCKSWEELVAARDVDVVVEALSGSSQAYNIVQTALDNTKHVVSANPVLMASHAEQLFKNATTKGVQLRCEAAVMGTAPCLHTLTVAMAETPVTRLVGQLNGPSNYMLERMTLRGETFPEAAKAAAELKQASRHSELDSAGKDTLYKMALLSYAAFGRSIPLERLQTEGIEGIDPIDLQLISRLGFVLKLVGLATPKKIMVAPMLVAADEPFANVPGTQTALHITSSAGPVTLVGEGGGLKVASAGIMAEVLAIARGRLPLPLGERRPPNTSEQVPERIYYVRLPAGESVKENGLRVLDQEFDADNHVSALLLAGRVSRKEVATHIGRADAVIYEVIDI